MAPGGVGSDAEATLLEGARALGVALAPDAAGRLVRFRDELARWNKVHNLTAVRDPDAMVVRHLLDSLSLVPMIAGPRVVDVGTGAGLPGLVLAVALPDIEFVLLDASAKRTTFVTHAVGLLGLTNVAVETRRVEDYRPPAAFDTVMCRAFAPIPRLLALAAHLCRRSGRILAMKGKVPRDELDQVGAGWRVAGVTQVAVPGLGASRCVVDLRPDAVGGGAEPKN